MGNIQIKKLHLLKKKYLFMRKFGHHYSKYIERIVSDYFNFHYFFSKVLLMNNFFNSSLNIH